MNAVAKCIHTVRLSSVDKNCIVDGVLRSVVIVCICSERDVSLPSTAIKRGKFD